VVALPEAKRIKGPKTKEFKTVEASTGLKE
jgi:hypothetical protein